MTQALPRCSDAARTRGDAPVGTGAPVARWLLVEHPGPWLRDAVASSGIAHSILDQMRSAASAVGGRVLLIRRPGRREASGVRSWAVVDSLRPATAPVWGAWERDRDLLEAVLVLRGGLPDGRRADLPGRPAGGAVDPILLVCAHGRHDVCCAVRGRPVAAALQARWPNDTWECSHVGGDRFAANVVVLPDGVFYGNLDETTAIAAVEAHLRGTTAVEHLRGLSTEPPVAQVAVAAALTRWAPSHPRSFRSTSVRQEAPNLWTVHLAGTSPLPDVVATVVTSARPPARLTCAALRETAAMAYEVASLAVDPGPG